MVGLGFEQHKSFARGDAILLLAVTGLFFALFYRVVVSANSVVPRLQAGRSRGALARTDILAKFTGIGEWRFSKHVSVFKMSKNDVWNLPQLELLPSRIIDLFIRVGINIFLVTWSYDASVVSRNLAQSNLLPSIITNGNVGIRQEMDTWRLPVVSKLGSRRLHDQRRFQT
jgi:hypothetical protein